MHTQSLRRVVTCLSTLGIIAAGCSSTDTPPGGEGGSSPVAGAGGATAGAPVVPAGAPPSFGGATPTAGAAPVAGSPVAGAPSAGAPSAGSGGAASGSGGGGAGGKNMAGGGPISGGAAGAAGTFSRGGGGSGGAPAGSAGANTAGQSGKGLAGDPVKSSGCGKESWPMSKMGNTIQIGGQSRTYHLRLPENYDTNRPYRLMLSYHWLNGTANEVANGGTGTVPTPYYGLWNLAENSTVFVAPQGINNSWPNDPNNIEFAKALIDTLSSQLCIDTKRIFAQGFSMGGSMSYAVACSLGTQVRAVAVYGGGPMSGCKAGHSDPVGYLMVHGTNDSVCKYPGYGVPQLNDFAKVNGCMAKTMPTPSGQDKGTCVDFEGCMPGYPARGCVHTGDHTPSPGGKMTWVPAEAWKFFSQF